MKHKDGHGLSYHCRLISVLPSLVLKRSLYLFATSRESVANARGASKRTSVAAVTAVSGTCEMAQACQVILTGQCALLGSFLAFLTPTALVFIVQVVYTLLWSSRKNGRLH